MTPFEVPAEYKAAYQRVIRLLPPEARGNQPLCEAALLFLKLGGEPLARHRLAVAKKPFRTRFFKCSPPEPSGDDQKAPADPDNEDSEDGTDMMDAAAESEDED
jgi:hypothetical protein